MIVKQYLSILKVIAFLSIIACTLLLISAWTVLPALENAVEVKSLKINLSDKADIYLPPLVKKEGKILVLRFNAYISSPIPAGCNYNLSVLINGSNVSQKNSDNKDRILGRRSSVVLTKGARDFPLFKGKYLMVFFAPITAVANLLSEDKQAATFYLDISDLVRGVDGNSITFQNLLKVSSHEGYGQLVIENIEIGYMPLNALQQNIPLDTPPARSGVASGIKTTTFELAQSKSGGFVMRLPQGLELLVETAVGSNPEEGSILLADDNALKHSMIRPTIQTLGTKGYAIQAAWKNIRLKRVLEIKNNILVWQDIWTNTGSKTIAIPFHYYVFLRNRASHYYIGGTDLVKSLECSAGNPTIFIEPEKNAGTGLGITAETDWLRLLMGLRVRKGIGEIYSHTLALGAGKSIHFDLTITPVEKDGYWEFINSVRNRWMVNGITMPRPVFWNYKKAKIDGNQEEVIKSSLGHLGPIIVCIPPWQRFASDLHEVKAKTYPKLPADKPRAPGNCPDFDVSAYLKFNHREKYWAAFKKEVSLLRKTIPNIKIIQMTHPAMAVVYKPLKERWPMAGDMILLPDGNAFESSVYSKAWLGDVTKQDWGVLYYVPKVGSPQFENVLSSIKRGLDDIGLDGIYVDEFSFVGLHRGYSRYDYRQWDGYSVDIDGRDQINHFKSDNAFVTIPSQIQIINEVKQRNKFFLGNTPPSSRELNRINHFRFAEGGNGTHLFPSMHLSICPLILGNLSDNSSLKVIMEDVRECLKFGTIYSPHDINLLLPGDKNFVCKLYPITVREIGPGWVIGDERIATIISGTYKWLHVKGKINLYYYDDQGKLSIVKSAIPVSDKKTLQIDVLKNGLTIAEMTRE